MTYTAIHRIGDGACGGIAFYYDEAGAPENMIEAERVTLKNGEKPTTGSIMVCGHCGAAISPFDLDWLPGEFEEIECPAKSSLKTMILTKASSLLAGFVNCLSRLRTKANGANVRER